MKEYKSLKHSRWYLQVSCGLDSKMPKESDLRSATKRVGANIACFSEAKRERNRIRTFYD